MERNKILIIEDELGIATMEKNYLIKNDYDVDLAHDGAQAIEMLENTQYDLVVLDLMIPKIPGEEILKYIRSFSDIPVILVTAKVSESDIISAFQSGADDYIKKPFSGLEFVERVKAVLKRTTANKTSKLIRSKDDKLVYDVENYRLLKDGQEVNLTKNELLILDTLLSNFNKTFTRNEIIDLAFGYDYVGFDRAIDTHIKNIRQKIENDQKKPAYIKTVYGIGYKAGDFYEVK